MNRNLEIDQYLKSKNHPKGAEIQRVREIIMDTHPKMEECIKWSCPTFVYKGNMASFFMNAQKHVSLMFHKGAFIQDETGLLQGDGKEGRTAKFENMEDIEKKKDDLQRVVLAWIKLQDEGKF